MFFPKDELNMLKILECFCFLEYNMMMFKNQQTRSHAI